MSVGESTLIPCLIAGLARSASLTHTNEEQEGLSIKFIDMVLPPPHERVFCGGDNIFAEPSGGPVGNTKLMRLTLRTSESP